MRFTKSAKKTIWTIVAIALVIVCIGLVVKGPVSILSRERNPENLIKLDSIELKTGKSATSDVQVDVDENGVVKLNGTVSADEDLVYASVELKAGKYMLTGAKDGSQRTYYLALKNGAEEYRSDLEGVISISSTTTFDVIIHVEDGTELKNVKIMPVLVEGETAGTFYK